MKSFFIVHPSLWIKFTLKLLSPWLSPQFKRKMIHLEKLGDLFNVIDQSLLKIPSFVYKYDRRLFGSNYLEDDPKNQGL